MESQLIFSLRKVQTVTLIQKLLMKKNAVYVIHQLFVVPASMGLLTFQLLKPCWRLFTARYLGVDISHDLSWKLHIARIIGKANKYLGFLRRNLKAKNPQLQECAYTIIRPQLEYATPVWDPHTKDNINKIEMVQKRAAQWGLNDYLPYLSAEDMLDKRHYHTSGIELFFEGTCPAEQVLSNFYSSSKIYSSIFAGVDWEK